jgi:hypothetical protein
MRALAVVIVAAAACSNTNTSTHFPYDPPPEPNGEPPNEAVGPEAAGAPMGPVSPGSPEPSPKRAPDPGPGVVGNPPAKPPAPPALTDTTPVDPDKPLPATSLTTDATLLLDQPAGVMVDGRADLYAAALAKPDAARGGVLPAGLVLAPSGGVLRFKNVSGKTACNGAAPAGPDAAGCAQLFGVFVGPRSGKPRRGAEEVATKALLHPALGVMFVVGDGLTGTGTGDVQKFAVPKGASRLYLGYVGDTYAHNAGGVSVTVTQSAK